MKIELTCWTVRQRKHCHSGLVQLFTVAFHCCTVANSTKYRRVVKDMHSCWTESRVSLRQESRDRAVRAVVFAVGATDSRVSEQSCVRLPSRRDPSCANILDLCVQNFPATSKDFRSDQPVSDEGVLDVTVRVAGRCGPASLDTQHQVSRYLRDKQSWVTLEPSVIFLLHTGPLK